MTAINKPKGVGGWELITPAKAMSYLRCNTRNYRVKYAETVSDYAEAMKAGAWQDNAEPIVIDEDGVLKNGQHRLTAVVESGVSVNMYVIKGVSRDANVYDTGRKRTEKDHARARGLQTLSDRELTIARLMVGHWDYRRARRVSNHDLLLDYAAAHENELKLALATARSAGSSSGGNISKRWSHLLCYMMLRNGYDANKMQLFFQVANSGIPIVGMECMPALVIRTQYATTMGGKTAAQEHEIMANVANAMEDFAAGKARRVRYTITKGMKWNPETLEALWHRIRQMDGIE